MVAIINGKDRELQAAYKKVCLLESSSSSDIFEITDTANMSASEAVEVIRKHWSKDLTYKGVEFFDDVYMDAILKFASTIFGTDNAQECYLGYLPSKDVFISGWDCFEDDEDGEYMRVAYDNGRDTPTNTGGYVYLKVTVEGDEVVDVEETTVNTDKGTEGDTGVFGMFYGSPYSSLSNYKRVHDEFKELVDIRLD
jgi:hypothetical protein